MKINKISTTIQLEFSQLQILNTIIESRKDKPSGAQIFREAFDLYVKNKYPQLCK